MTDTNKPVSLGGRPTKIQEAETKHTKAQAKIDLAMAKLTDPAIAQLEKLMASITDHKVNHQLVIIERILSFNKEYMKAKLDAELGATSPKINKSNKDPEEWVAPTLDLSSLTETLN
jgi:hypothetical protein